MKKLLYEHWYKKRVNKIINLFGEDWFANKKILELGAAHGDIGIEFLKLGSSVLFTDARQEYLDTIISTLAEKSYTPKTLLLDQNTEYNIAENFDLVLHLGVLYHLKNWKEDLKCALSHTNTMILETAVMPKNVIDQVKENKTTSQYGPVNNEFVQFTQESVEKVLTDLGCKYIRFDNAELNYKFSPDTVEIRISHIYDWNYNTAWTYNIPNHEVHYRRMWLVLK